MCDLDGPLCIGLVSLPSGGQSFIPALGLNVDERDPGAAFRGREDCRRTFDANRPILWRHEGIAENGGLRRIASETFRLLGRCLSGWLFKALIFPQKQNETEQQEKADER